MRNTLILLAVSAALALGGCGLLDMNDGGITITLPAQEFDFDLDANQAKAQLQAYLATQPPPLNSLDLTNQTEIPAEVCAGGTCVPVPRIQETLEFETPAQQIDLRDEPDLKNYIQAGKVKKVNIDYIEYQVATNTLNFNLPALELFLDDHGTTSVQPDSAKIARLPEIAAGATPSNRVQFTVDGRQLMSDYLIQDFAFAFMAQGALGFDTNVTRTIPGGRLVGKVTVQVSFQVDPL